MARINLLLTKGVSSMTKVLVVLGRRFTCERCQKRGYVCVKTESITRTVPVVVVVVVEIVLIHGPVQFVVATGSFSVK